VDEVNIVLYVNHYKLIKNNMKKILQIVDTYGWAIDKLSRKVVEYNPRYSWQRMEVHPKGLERGEIDLEPIRKAIEWADIIDFQYWRTASQLAEMIPELKNKKVMLTHHNEKNLLSENWDYVDLHIAETFKSFNILKEKYSESKIVTVHNSYNPNRFVFNDEYPPKNDKPVIGYVGRIVPWKGLKELLKACYELDYTVMIMGKMDSPTYYAEIPDEHKEIIDWSFFDCGDDDVADFYKNIDIYVGNSGSGRETGPLGLIEAMGSGVPCITTLSGIANDIAEDQENCLVVDFDDEDGLRAQLQNLAESVSLKNTLRNNAWETIKSHNHYARSYAIGNAISDLIYPEDLVSVILPATYGRYKEVLSILERLKEQTYKDFEVILIWDELSQSENINKDDYPFALEILYTGKEGYNLAMARNMGTVEARGKFLMFCDSRLNPANDAIETFVKESGFPEKEKIKYWLFGNKNKSNKESFVENFSFINRDQFIKAGMMSERIDEYGGISQELRERFNAQGFSLKFVQNAHAEEISSAKRNPERRNSIIRMKNLLNKLYV